MSLQNGSSQSKKNDYLRHHPIEPAAQSG